MENRANFTPNKFSINSCHIPPVQQEIDQDQFMQIQPQRSMIDTPQGSVVMLVLPHRSEILKHPENAQIKYYRRYPPPTLIQCNSSISAVSSTMQCAIEPQKVASAEIKKLRAEATPFVPRAYQLEQRKNVQNDDKNLNHIPERNEVIKPEADAEKMVEVESAKQQKFCDDLKRETHQNNTKSCDQQSQSQVSNYCVSKQEQNSSQNEMTIITPLVMSKPILPRLEMDSTKEIKRIHRYTHEQLKALKENEFVIKDPLPLKSPLISSTLAPEIHRFLFGKDLLLGVPHEDLKSKKAQNFYEPTFMQKKDEAKDDGLEEKVKNVLLSLTPQNFNFVLKEISKMTINTSEQLRKLVNKLYEKAIAQPDFAKLYTKLFSALSSGMVKDASNKKVWKKSTLKVYLTSRCQVELENAANNNGDCELLASHIKDLEEMKMKALAFDEQLNRIAVDNHVLFDDELKNIEDKLIETDKMRLKIAEKREQKRISIIEDFQLKNAKDRVRRFLCLCKKEQEDLEEFQKELRHQAKGTANFFGELFNVELLTSTFMISFINILMESSVSKENLEQLCNLLLTTAKVMDQKYPQDAKKLDPYFVKLQSILDKGNIKMESRILCELQKVFELRGRNGMPRTPINVTSRNRNHQQQSAAPLHDQNCQCLDKAPKYHKDEDGFISVHSKFSRTKKLRESEQQQANSNPFSCLSEDSDGSEFYTNNENFQNRGRGRRGGKKLKGKRQEPEILEVVEFLSKSDSKHQRIY